jgi:licheninase
MSLRSARLVSAAAAASVLVTGAVIPPASADTVVYQDSFASGLSSRWSVDTSGLHRSENVGVSEGVLTVQSRRTADGWTSGSATLARLGDVSEVTLRVRMDEGSGVRGTVVLRPAGATSAARLVGLDLRAEGSRATSHLATIAAGGQALARQQHPGPFTSYRTLTLRRSNDQLVALLDGVQVARLSGDTLTGPLELVVRSEPGLWAIKPDASTPSSVRLQIDSMTVVSADSSTTTPPPSGRQLVFSDDFNGTALDTSKWGIYRGTAPGSIRTAENVSVGNGILRLRTQKDAQGNWSAAGVSNYRSLVQTYGEYQVRLRIDKGKGVKGVALLWPTGDWPPEVDFFEIASRERDVNVITVHHGTRENRKMIHRQYAADFTQWQTVGVRWSPGKLEFTLNGQVKEIVTNGVPDEPMWLALQSNIGTYVPVDSTTPPIVDYEIDWVRIYSHG